MDVKITKEITGFREETYIATLTLRESLTCNFMTKEGGDLWKADPEAARKLVTDTIEKLKSKIRNRMAEELLKEYEKIAEEKGYVVTQYVKKKLLLIHPDEESKIIQRREMLRRKLGK